jgi:hypothetical protein
MVPKEEEKHNFPEDLEQMCLVGGINIYDEEI